MADVHHALPHDLERTLAKRAVEAAFASYRVRFAKYEPALRWRDEWTAEASFRAAGIGFTGSVHVAPLAIDFTLAVPLPFRPLRGRAFAVVEREFAAWLAKAKAGELPA